MNKKTNSAKSHLTKTFLGTLGIVLCLVTAQTALAQLQDSCGQVTTDTVLMLDRTPSVSAEERQNEEDAAKDLIDLLLSVSGNRVAVGRFAGDGVYAEIVSPLGDDAEVLKADVESAMNSSSSYQLATNLEEAVGVVHDELTDPLDEDANDEKILILISDGDPNRPAETPAENDALALAAALNAKDDGIRMFTIAFDAFGEEDEDNRALLAEMASHDSTDDSEGEVSDEERDAENADGDDFFIAPAGEDLQSVFDLIGGVILCDVPEEETPEDEENPKNEEILEVTGDEEGQGGEVVSEPEGIGQPPLLFEGSGNIGGCSIDKTYSGSFHALWGFAALMLVPWSLSRRERVFGVAIRVREKRTR